MMPSRWDKTLRQTALALFPALLFTLAFNPPALAQGSEDGRSWLPEGNLTARDSGLIMAMGRELGRSVDSLKLPGLPGPYFISYLLWDMDGFETQASLGSVEKSGRDRQLMLDADLRVGDYRLDNSLYQGGFVFGPTLRSPLPRSGDTLLLRQAIWSLTDARYKVALEMLAQKKAFMSQTREREKLPDFSRQRVLRQIDRDKRFDPDTAAWSGLCRRLSARLIDYPHILESRVAFQHYYTSFYYVDSEGSAYIISLQEHTLVASLLTQAEDGTPLWDFFRLADRDSLVLNPWPGDAFESRIADSLTALAKRLEILIHAPTIDNYRGPVLFTGQAAGDLIHRALLLPQTRLREPLGSNSEPDFLVSLKGRRYFPKGIQVRDNPGLRAWNGHSLFGAYRFDHQGQPARRLDLVEDGRLKDFYQGKVPVFSARDSSNGHWRYGGGFPGVVQVTAQKTDDEKQLHRKLLALAKDEGLKQGLMVLRTVDEDAFQLLTHPLADKLPVSDPAGSPGSFAIPAPCAVDKMDVRTGKRQPVRGLVFPPLDSKSLRDIVAVGNKPYLLEPQASFSVLCPSLLFSLLDMKHPRISQPRLPYLAPAGFASQP